MYKRLRLATTATFTTADLSLTKTVPYLVHHVSSSGGKLRKISFQNIFQTFLPDILSAMPVVSLHLVSPSIDLDATKQQ
jgi:hypothetical protein